MQRIRRAFWWLITAPFRLVFWIISLPFRFLGWLFRPVLLRIKQGRIYRFMTESPEDDRPAIDAVVDAFQEPAGVLEHLDVLRKHLLRMLLAVMLTVIVSFYFTQDFIAYLSMPVGGLENLQAIEVTESLSVFMRVALLSGLALASPYIAFEIWLFIAPGLMPRSRQVGLFSIPLALVFFLGGAAFAYYLMLPTALPFLLDFLGIQAKLRPDSYFQFVTALMFWIGVAFEFPLVIFALSAIGILEPKVLVQQWRLAIILIAVLSAVITPTVDPVNMALVMAPMTALYFLSILFSAIARAANRKAS